MVGQSSKEYNEKEQTYPYIGWLVFAVRQRDPPHTHKGAFLCELASAEHYGHL